MFPLLSEAKSTFFWFILLGWRYWCNKYKVRQVTLRGQHTNTCNQPIMCYPHLPRPLPWLETFLWLLEAILKKKFLKGYKKSYVGARSESQCTTRVKRRGWEMLARNVKLRWTVPFHAGEGSGKPNQAGSWPGTLSQVK